VQDGSKLTECGPLCWVCSPALPHDRVTVHINILACTWITTSRYMLTLSLWWTYTSALQAAFGGFSSLCPPSNIFRSDMGSTAGYGILPAMNISQDVTPKAHCERHIFWVSVPAGLYAEVLSYHITFLWEHSILEALWWYPLVGQVDIVTAILALFKVSTGIHIFSQPKVRHLDVSIDVQPAWKVQKYL